MERPENGTIYPPISVWNASPGPMKFSCSASAFSLNDTLRNEFEAVACVEIFNPAELHARWLKALPDEVKYHVSTEVGDHRRYVSRKVTYYTPEELMGPDWAIPDMITTSKLRRFAYQDEYRFAFTKTDAFTFQNCTYQLTNRRARPTPKPEEHFSETLELGDLRDICRIVVF
jgi:hypothetical protein